MHTTDITLFEDEKKNTTPSYLSNRPYLAVFDANLTGRESGPAGITVFAWQSTGKERFQN